MAKINLNLKTTLPAIVFVILLAIAGIIFIIIQTAPGPDIYVDVVGAVESPGVVVLPAGSRVMDAIDAAGGLSDEADGLAISRATKLSDGDKIRIPTREEVMRDGFDKDKLVSTGSPDAKININTADAEELMRLYNVGETIAKNIVDYRKANGAFKTIEDIQNVSGIGPKTFEKIKAHIVC